MENLDQSPEMLEAALEALKDKAKTLGITFHTSIGYNTLSEKISAHLAKVELEKSNPEPVSAIPKIEVAPFVPPSYGDAQSNEPPVPVVETIHQKRLRMKQEALALVRVNVTCMNPMKKEWAGEILTTGNSLLGTVSKYIPFNTTDGWHIPRILYNMIKERECQIFVDDGKGGRKGKMIREFAIEIMDPLTPQELTELAARQAATRAID